jgi:hypothetical protein
LGEAPRRAQPGQALPWRQTPPPAPHATPTLAPAGSAPRSP